MKKTMTKVFALVLVLAMVIGFVAMIPAQATEIEEANTPSAQFVSNNVEYADCMKLMYAVHNTSGKECTVTLTTADNETYTTVQGANVNLDVNGVETSCETFTSEYGVPLQNIETVITATVSVDGVVQDTLEYSVLEYLREMQTQVGGGLTDHTAEEASVRLEMYASLLESADAIRTVLEKDPIGSYGYIYVENGTYDNERGTLLSTDDAFDASLLATTEGTNPSWQYKVVGSGNDFADLPANLEVGTNNIILKAVIDETTDPEETVLVADGNYVIVANGNAAMDTKDNGNGKIAPVTVAVNGDEVTGDEELLWTVTNKDDGITLFNGSKYLKYASGTNLALTEEEYVWTITEGAEGCYRLTSATEGRGLLFRNDSQYTLFGGYATSNIGNDGYSGDLKFCVLKVCEHPNGYSVDPVEASCTAVGYTEGKYCDDCGKYYEGHEEVAKLPHTEETIPAVEATCTEKGWTEGVKCSVCNTVLKEQTEVSAGHIDEDEDGICDREGCGENLGGEEDPEVKDPKWVLVTDVSKIKNGDKIVIVNTANAKAMSTTQNSNNRGAASVTIVDEMIDEVGAEVQQITLVQNGEYWNLMTEEGQYLYAASTSKNYLKTSSNNTNDNAMWKITIDSDGVATIKANQSARNWMRFNLNNGNNIFACYTSGQLDVAIFVLTTDY